ncbi:peptidyl-prolyl cis-trans isomerase [Sulfuriferula sp. GW1]|uniref:peptidylprolyl isomerase n=1 Tax=Sulfuriferula sp. GW1 TaxID=3345111 RepID=UPI0039AE9FCA
MLLKKITAATVCVIGLTALTGCNAAETTAKPDTKVSSTAASSKPVAVVNGIAIPQSQYDLLKQDRIQQGQPDNEQTAAALRDSLINAQILAQQATKMGLDKDPTMQTRLDLVKTEMLAKAFLANYIKTHPISEADLKAQYDKVKAQMGSKEYEVSHILVDNEAEAKKIIAELNSKKAKFEDLAKKYSKDSSAAKGGLIGWAAPGNLVKEFSDAMVQLKKGEYTKTPVHTQFGWHVIRVDNIRDLKLPPFNEVKDQLRGQMEQEMIKKEIADMRASAKVE